MSSSLPVPISPNSSSIAVEVLQKMNDFVYKITILEEENKSLKLENQRLKTEMEKMSIIDLKKNEEGNLAPRKLRKIKTEPEDNDGNTNEGSQSQPPDLINPHGVPNSIQGSGSSQAYSSILNDRRAERLNRIVNNCNLCKNHVKTRHHCIVCEDFNLCVGCYRRQGHPHKMQKILDETEIQNGLNSPSDSSNSGQEDGPAQSHILISIDPQDQEQDKIVFTCKICKIYMKTRCHCTVCEDFDLCVDCYERQGHPHKMMKVFGEMVHQSCSVSSTSVSPWVEKQTTPEARKLLFQRYIQDLLHACSCDVLYGDVYSPPPISSCEKMKRVVEHAQVFKAKKSDDCPLCKHLMVLWSYHEKHCIEINCGVPFCAKMKQNSTPAHPFH